jgi:hypothetical protein
MKKLLAAALCLLTGSASALFVFAHLDHAAHLGPKGPLILGAAMLAFLLLFTTGFVLSFSRRDGRRAASTMKGHAQASKLTQRFGLKAGVYGLVPGTAYRVIRLIKDCHGSDFAVGEELTFAHRDYLPYHGGHTIVFRQRAMYLQDEVNADLLNALDAYLEVAPVPSSMTDAPEPAPVSSAPASPAKPLRVWQSRYSSTEIMYLELHAAEARLELCGCSSSEERWSHAQVLAGEADRSILTGFSAKTLAELKIAVVAAGPFLSKGSR